MQDSDAHILARPLEIDHVSGEVGVHDVLARAEDLAGGASAQDLARGGTTLGSLGGNDQTTLAFAFWARYRAFVALGALYLAATS